MKPYNQTYLRMLDLARNVHWSFNVGGTQHVPPSTHHWNLLVCVHSQLT